MKAGWALLRRRDFGLLWAGGLISETGDWFLLVGLPFWVLQETGSSLVTASVFLVGLLPGLVAGPLAGVLVDRWDRRRTLVAVSLAEAAFLLPLLAVDGQDRLWIVYLVIAVEATLAQLNDPARNALVPTLVPKDDLVGANALIGLNTNVARLAGSPLGGILVEVAGLPGLVIGDAASFLLGAALIGLVRPVGVGRQGTVGGPGTMDGPATVEQPMTVDALATRNGPVPLDPAVTVDPAVSLDPAASLDPALTAEPSVTAERARTNPASRFAGPRRGSVADGEAEGSGLSTGPVQGAAAEPRGVVGEWVDGLRVVADDRELVWGLVVNGLAAVAQGIFTVLFVLFVTRVLGGDGADVGLLRGVQAIGGLLGGVVVVGLARRLEPGRLLGVSLLVFAVIDLAMWNGPLVTTSQWLYLGLFVAAGIPGIGFLTGLTALVQERTEDAYLGRVFATYYGAFNGLMALGMLLAGLLGDTVGVVPVLNGQAGLYLLAGVVAVATLGRARPAGYPRTSKRERIPLA
jgi:MFS family permease